MAPVFPPAPPVEGLPAMAKQLYMGKKTVVEEEEVEEELLRPNNYMNYKPQVQKQVNAQQIQKVADKRKRGKVEVPKQQKNMEKKNKKMRAGALAFKTNSYLHDNDLFNYLIQKHNYFLFSSQANLNPNNRKSIHLWMKKKESFKNSSNFFFQRIFDSGRQWRMGRWEEVIN